MDQAKRPRESDSSSLGQKTDSQQIKLPDRKEITLCEAVTAFVFGKACNSLQYMLYGGEPDTEEQHGGEPGTEEQSTKAKYLIERLHPAAYAGRVRFRALKNGDSHTDGHKDIDPLYFSEPRGLRWEFDEIWVRDLSPQNPKFKAQGRLTRDWRDVHLDRGDFEVLLRSMGVSVMQSPDVDVLGDQKIYKTGVAGRPTSIGLVLPLARERLNAGDYPESLAKFSEQLAEYLVTAEPGAPRITPKTIRNNQKFRELWRQRPPKNIDPS
jgi:hypothetical protein